MFAYAPVNEAAVLERHGWALHPALIVLQLYQNDLYLGKATAGSPVQPTLGNRARAVRQWILNSSALYRRSYQALHAVAYKAFHRYRREHPEKLNGAEPQMIAAMLAAHPHDADFESLAIVEKMHAEAVRRGIPLLVVLTPNEAQLFFDRYDRIEQRVGAFCRARGIPFHAALPMLRARPDRVDLYVDGLHFSPAGHRAMADWLAPFLANALAQPAW
jgi:hypothetical protein